MRVLLVTKNFDSHSGIGRYSQAVREHLRSASQEVVSAGHGGDSEFCEHKTPADFLKNCLRVRRAARACDVVHALDAWPYGVYALFAVLGTTKKLFIGGVGTYSIPPRSVSFKRFLLLAVYKRAAAVFCISAYTKERIAARLPFTARLQVVHLAAERFTAPSQDVRTRFSIPSSARPIFITVGALKERKGQLDTVQALSKLKKNFPRFLYLMVGSSDDNLYVHNIRVRATELGISENIRLIDSVSTDAELAGLYSIADILFLNSNNDGDHFEGFGLVFLEANQFGVPGVGSRDCGIEDAIQDNVSGLLVPQKDHDAITDAAQKILSNKKQFAQGALDWYTRFSWEKTIASYLKFYTA